LLLCERESALFFSMFTKLRWQIIILVVTAISVAGLLMLPEKTEVAFAPQASEGGIYTEALIGSYSRLNPLLDLNNSADRDVDRLIYSRLISYDASGLPIPDLADSWGVSQDGKTYNFTIRKNAKWHDGQAVSADDVIFTISLIKAPESLFPQSVKDLWSKIEIHKLNDQALQFVLPESFAPFLDYLTFGVLPQHLLQGVSAAGLPAADINLNPIGSGPYKFDTLQITDGVVTGVELSVNPDYYGKKPFLDKVVFKYFGTPEAAWQAYQAGEVLGVSQITSATLNQALSDPTLNVYTARLPELSLIFLNLNDPELPFFQDVEFRKALFQGLNRDYMVSSVLGGQAIVANGPIFPHTWAYNEKLTTVPYDPEAAIKTLKDNKFLILESGGSVRSDLDGNRLEFTLSHPDDELHTRLAEIIQKNWEVLGINVILEPLPYDILIHDRLEGREYQAALIDINLHNTPDPDPYPFWHESEVSSGQNYSQWVNRAASEYIERARINPDYAERAKNYKNFQVVFNNEMPALPLYYPVYSFGINSMVWNAQLPPMFDTSDRFQTISDWYIVTRQTIDLSGKTGE